MPQLKFDNSYVRLPDNFYAKVEPDQPTNPGLIRINTKLAELLGLDLDWLNSDAGLAMLSGQKLPDGAEPIAMAYAGHQFGGWSPTLGDGRALLIGEIISQDGIRRDIQLKGSGQTPFSRQGDGKSALGPVMREYIVSEAMAALGVPTTRALAAVTTGDMVFRNGMEPGGILTRVAQSHVRIGTFQYFYAREDNGAVKTLADYVIKRHYPDANKSDNPYAKMLSLIVERQAKLIAKWMSLGFIHGVMNTDNMQIAGETIDYGPCAFMDVFHPETVFSSIDRNGRYSWANQSNIGKWNLLRLADTLLPIIDDDIERAKVIAEEGIGKFDNIFEKTISSLFNLKLGLLNANENQHDLIKMTFEMMTKNEVDFTLFFRHLTKVADGGSTEILCSLFNDPKDCEDWLVIWREYISKENTDPNERLKIMRANNPVLIPRNHRIAEAIKAGEGGDFEMFHKLVDAYKKPFDEQPEYTELEKAPTKDEIVHETFCGT
ncbi:MAG: YdiU family protein [Emcibacteraceae bacterium]|nr:YdiU family protein [Emcibacteraceae bacterium]